MITRQQLPVWSPITLGAIGSGIFPATSATSALTRHLVSEFGAASATLTGSGTVALALAFLASGEAGVRPRIGLPAWGCPDLMSAADAVDAEVCLYDLDPATLAPDPGSLRAALGAGLHAVVVAHWFGLPVDLSALAPLVASAGALLIEDAAQGAGAVFAGRPVGSAGDLGVLSFGRGKGRTGGGGGALLAGTERGAGRLGAVGPRLGQAGAGWGGLAGLAAQWTLGRPSLYRIPSALPWLRLGETVYHPAPALRGMTARAAAVVEAIWTRSLAEAEIRRSNAGRWSAGLRGAAGVTGYGVAPGAEAGWLRFPVLADDDHCRSLASSAARRHGVARGYPLKLSDLPVAPGRIPEIATYPGAEILSRSLFTLPTHRLVSASDFSHVFQCVHAS